MPDLHELAAFILQLSHKWAQSISDPKQFLSQAFQPTDDQLLSGLEFYFGIIAISLLLYAPFVLGSSKGELSDKVQLVASSFVNLFFGAVLAMSWHFAFWLLGGASNFSGTYLAYVYGGAPFVPLITLSSLIIFGALPPNLRQYALNPTTAQKAMKAGIADPRTSNTKIILGTLLTLGFTAWSIVVQFRCMSFAQNVRGWRLVLVIVLILPISMLVGYLSQTVQAVFIPSVDETLPVQSAPDILIPAPVVKEFDSTQSAP